MKDFIKKHHIVRNAIKEDVLYFAIPSIVVMIAGMGISGWDLVRRQMNLFVFSLQNILGLALIIIGILIELVAQITLWRFYSSTLVIKKIINSLHMGSIGLPDIQSILEPSWPVLECPFTLQAYMVF